MSEPEQPSPDELLDAVRQMKVSDLLLSTAATLAQLGFAKLDESTRDLEQARLAIEGMKALLGAGARVPAEVHRDFSQRCEPAAGLRGGRVARSETRRNLGALRAHVMQLARAAIRRQSARACA